jgi:predicted Zn-dependent protease with MMP-like domain
VDFRSFERFAHEVFDDIPEEYRAGVDGLVVRRDAVPHPELAGIWTLGECLTEEHVSDFASADTTRSLIALYWGSFRNLARDDEDFDWDEEVWETLTHEIRHHLESLAGDDALEDVDYAADESFRRFEGQRFDPWYWQHGDEVEPGLFRVERAWYLGQEWTEEAFRAATEVAFEWRQGRFRVPRPDELGDVHFILVHGLALEPTVDAVELVLVRRRTWFQHVRRMLSASGAVVLESEAEAEPVGRVG